jgi:hypothetical protein
MNRAARVVPFSILIHLALTHACHAGHQVDFADAWNGAGIVVLGRPHASDDLPGDAERGWKRYVMDVELAVKGTLPPGPLRFIDQNVRTDASLHLREGATYLVFLATPGDLKFSNPSQEGIGTELFGISVFEVNKKNRETIEAGIAVMKTYPNLSQEDRKGFLLKNLPIENPYVHDLIVREILVARTPEAIPYFQQKLSGAIGEEDKIKQLSCLRCLGDPGVKATLIRWLNNDTFTRKADILEELIRLGDKTVVPEIRRWVNHKDEIVAAVARNVLLRYGEPDAIGLLLDMIHRSKDPAVRYNAIHYLNWGYPGGFTDEQKTAIRALVQDGDERIARVAGFIVEKW